MCRGIGRQLLCVYGVNDLTTVFVDRDNWNAAERPSRQLVGQFPNAICLRDTQAQPRRIEARVALRNKLLCNSEKIAL